MHFGHFFMIAKWLGFAGFLLKSMKNITMRIARHQCYCNGWKIWSRIIPQSTPRDVQHVPIIYYNKSVSLQLLMFFRVEQYSFGQKSSQFEDKGLARTPRTKQICSITETCWWCIQLQNKRWNWTTLVWPISFTCWYTTGCQILPRVLWLLWIDSSIQDIWGQRKPWNGNKFKSRRRTCQQCTCCLHRFIIKAQMILCDSKPTETKQSFMQLFDATNGIHPSDITIKQQLAHPPKSSITITRTHCWVS